MFAGQTVSACSGPAAGPQYSPSYQCVHSFGTAPCCVYAENMAVVALLDHGKLMMEEAGGTKTKDVAFVPGALVVKVGSGHYSFSFVKDMRI